MRRDYKRPDGRWTNGYVNDSGFDEYGNYIRPEDRGKTDEDKIYEQRKAQERSNTVRSAIDGANEIGREAWEIGVTPHVRLTKEVGRATKKSIVPAIIGTVILVILSSILSFIMNNQLIFIFVGLAAFCYFGYKRHKINEYKKNGSYHNRY